MDLRRGRELSREVRLRASLYTLAVVFAGLHRVHRTESMEPVFALAGAACVMVFINHLFELEDTVAFRTTFIVLETLFYGFVAAFTPGSIGAIFVAAAVGLASIQFGQNVGTYYALFFAATQIILGLLNRPEMVRDFPMVFLRVSLPLWSSYLGAFAYSGAGTGKIDLAPSGQKHALQNAQGLARTETKVRLEREQELFEERRRLEALLEISQRISSIRSPEDLLASIVECAKEQVQAGAVILMLRRNDELVPAWREGLTDIGASLLSCKIDQGLLGQLLRSGQPFRFSASDNYAALRNLREIGSITQMLSGHKSRAQNLPKSDEIRNFLSVALVSPQEKVPVGLLIMLNRNVGDEFPEGDQNYLQILANSAAISIKNLNSIRELSLSHNEMIQALAQAIEAKDSYTHGHVDRVRQYSVKLARAMGLPIEFVQDVRTAAILHDVGKISTPDRVLLKAGPLNDEEFEIMKQHAVHSVRILRDIRSVSPDIQKMVLHHHERWDGKGYPSQLKGSDIPLGAQIIAVADCYDAMTSDRPYRKGFPPREALHKMALGAGTQHNAEILAFFLALFNYDPVGLEPIAELTRQATLKVGANLMKIPDPDIERRQQSTTSAPVNPVGSASPVAPPPKKMLELESG